MEIIATITQHELIFEPDQSLIGYQWSENLGIKVVYDDTFEGWSVKWDAITSGHKNKRIPLVYDKETNIITLNKECFNDDYLYMACAFIRNGQVRNSAPIEFYVGESVNHGLDTMPKVPGLYEEMQILFEQIFSNEYKQPLDDLFEKADEAAQAAITAGNNANAAANAANIATTNANTAAQVANLAKVNADAAAASANTAANAALSAKNAANTAAQEANTATANANDAAQAANDIAKEIERKLIAGELSGDTPIGVIHEYAGEIAPAGYLLCDGQAVSRNEYANLYAVIGERYGAGDGATTFHLPDLRGRVAVGCQMNDTDFDTLGKQGGSKKHTLTSDEMPSHTHVQNAHKHSATGSSNEAGAHTHGASSNSTGAHTHTVSGTAASAGNHTHIISAMCAYPLGGTPAKVPNGSYYNLYSGHVECDTTGAHTHTVSGTAASAGTHSHTVTVNSGGAHSHTITVNVNEATAVNQNTGGGLAHNNMQPYIVLNYIIKY